MKRLLFALALLIPCLSPLTTANAADFSVNEFPEGGGVAILVLGEIEAGDSEKFRQIALQHDRAIVILESPGGAVGPALEIGRAINLSGYATAVVEGSQCTSACALIWLAGSVRLLSSDAQLGFHASYRDENGMAVESGAANALIGQYLTQLGLPSKAILFATLAPPNDFLWLDEATREQSGITFEVLEDESPPQNRDASVTPAPHKPTIKPLPQSGLEERLSMFPQDWVTKKASKYGMDITPDGRIWFNSDPYGDEVDYGVSADDLWAAKGRYRKAWVRGYHKRDLTVPYRESLQLIHADCANDRWGSEMVIHYDADGKAIYRDSGPVTWEPVIPRTYAETWIAVMCAD